MKNIRQITFAMVYLVLGAVVLSSCSKPQYYSFHNDSKTYGSEKAETVVELETAEVLEVETEDALVSNDAKVVISAESSAIIEKEMANIAAQAENKGLRSKASQLKSANKIKKEVKAVAKELKKQGVTDFSNLEDHIEMEDKSNAGSNQLVALLLAIFLGGLGIHRFYLGYIGIGIVQLLLALLGFLIVPLIVLFIWVLIDIIRIATGALGPKNGEYTDTL